MKIEYYVEFGERSCHTGREVDEVSEEVDSRGMVMHSERNDW